MKSAQEIQEHIYKLVESLDNITDLWAKAKADFNYAAEMKKVVLNLAKKLVLLCFLKLININ